jgi:hypothetical protein
MESILFLEKRQRKEKRQIILPLLGLEIEKGKEKKRRRKHGESSR